MAVHILVERPNGALVLQRRSSGKRIQPGRWDTSVGGHVDFGEDPDAAARRELEEELGITGVTPRELHQYLWESTVEREYVTTYQVIWDGAVLFPEAEISDVRDWTVEEILAAPQDLFTPNFRHELERFLSSRGAAEG